MIISELLKFGGLKNAFIFAGQHGINNEIDSATVLEVADTKGQNWLIRNQLYITSFYAIMNDVDKQYEVISSLIEANSAGVVVCHIDKWLKRIDERIEELCNEKGFPLIIANSDTTYIEILNPIILKLMGEPTKDIINMNLMQNKLIEYVVSNKDVKIIYRTMTEYFGKTILFLDIDKKLLYPNPSPKSIPIINFINENMSIENSKSQNIIKIEQCDYMLYPVKYDNLYFGTLIANVDMHNIENSKIILNIISRVFTLISTKSSRVSEIEIRRQQEYLGDLITWNFRNDEVAIKMGNEINWDIRKSVQLIVININKIQEYIGENSTDIINFIFGRQYELIRQTVIDECPDNLIGYRSDLFIILLSKKDNSILNRADRLGEKIIDIWDENLSGNISLGISSVFSDFKYIPLAYKEAMDAAKFGRTYVGENIVSNFRGLGCYALINELKEDKRIVDMNNLIFESIHSYDQLNNQSLYLTLVSLIMNNMNIEKVSSELFIHRNTVLYRKNKIVELLGYEPWSMPYLLNTLIAVITQNRDT